MVCVPIYDNYVYGANAAGTTAHCFDGLNRIEGQPATDCTGTMTNVPSYDDHENMTASGTGDSYDYDPLNRLTETAGGDTLDYGADGQFADLDGTRRFQYDGNNVAAEWTTSWNMTRRYVYDGGEAPLMDYNGATTSNRTWYLTDERGSVMARTNDSGNVFGINTYDEYGVEPTGANSSLFGYAGMMRLDNGDLTHNRNRAYNPELGRFLQMDPIGQAGGLNLYAYVGGDPVNFTDPSGLAHRPGGRTRPIIPGEIVSECQKHRDKDTGEYSTVCVRHGLAAWAIFGWNSQPINPWHGGAGAGGAGGGVGKARPDQCDTADRREKGGHTPFS